jgi:hypothetical protein
MAYQKHTPSVPLLSNLDGLVVGDAESAARPGLAGARCDLDISVEKDDHQERPLAATGASLATWMQKRYPRTSRCA